MQVCFEVVDIQTVAGFYGSYKYYHKGILGELGTENCGYQVKKHVCARTGINFPDLIKKMLGGDGSKRFVTLQLQSVRKDQTSGTQEHFGGNERPW